MTADDSPADRRLPWWWRASLIVLGLAMAAFRLTPTEADPDLWGHLRFGLDLLDTGRIVRPDPYSYLTSGQPWINHEWLAEAVLALAWRAAGAPALVLLKLALALAVAIVVCRHLVQRGVSLLASLLLTAYGMAIMLPAWRSLRPQAFTYLACALLLVLIHRATRGRPALLWLAPPLMALWANLHGGFVAGLGLLALAGVAQAIDARGDRRQAHSPRRALFASLVICGTCLASAAATLINPYGWTLWSFLARTLGPRPDIAEWQSVPLLTVQGGAYLVVIVLGALGLIASRLRRHPADVVLFVCGAALPLIAQRHLPLCVLITLIFCGEHIASAASAIVLRLTPHDRPSRAPGDRDAHPTDRFRPLVAAALLVEAAVVTGMTIAAPTAGRIVYRADDYPVAATARLAESGVAANLAVFFDWGEYVIWHAGPRIKVSVDGRRETVYSEVVYEENMAFTDGIGPGVARGAASGVAPDTGRGVSSGAPPGVAWDRLLTHRPTDLVLVSAVTPAYRLIAAHPDWELIVQDGPAALFGRRGGTTTSHLQARPARALPRDATLIFP